MYDVICVGSATVDCFVGTKNRLFKGKGNKIVFPFGRKILVSNLNFYTGGTGNNVSSGLSKIGVNAALLTKIGYGENSKRIINSLKEYNVKRDLIVRGNKTDFSVILDAEGHDRTILVFKDASKGLKWNRVKKNKLKTKWFYLSSSVGDTFNTLKKLAVFAKKNNIKITTNPSSYLAKRGKKYLGPILKNADILILNKDEARLLSGKKDIKKILKDLVKSGPRIAVVTDGPNKVFVYDGKVVYSAKPKQVKVVEATGAGDAFSAGFLGAYIKKNDVELALKAGLVNSVSVIQYFGTKNKLLKWPEILNGAKRYKVSKRFLK